MGACLLLSPPTNLTLFNDISFVTLVIEEDDEDWLYDIDTGTKTTLFQLSFMLPFNIFSYIACISVEILLNVYVL